MNLIALSFVTSFPPKPLLCGVVVQYNAVRYILKLTLHCYKLPASMECGATILDILGNHAILNLPLQLLLKLPQGLSA